MSPKNVWSRSFPPPAFLTMEAVGLDISDHAIKYVEFGKRHGRRELIRFGERPLPAGVIVGGEVMKPDLLASALADLKKEGGLSLVRSALPESGGYLFQTSLANVSPSEAKSAIEFQLEEHIPLTGAEAIFDAEPAYRQGKEGQLDFVVTAFPQKTVLPYTEAFRQAGLFLLSLELEAQAIARAVVPWHDAGTFLIVDLGETHTGVAAVSGGIVHYTSTIDIAGHTLTAALGKSFAVSDEKAEQIKHEKGFIKTAEDREVFDSLMTTVSALADEISRRISYWDAHFDDHFGRGKIEHVYLCGGNANVTGLAEYFSANLRLPVSVADVWTNAFTFDEYVPALGLKESRRYTTAIGLALRREL